MISDKEYEIWRDKTRMLILETELLDNEYRRKHPGHKCDKSWFEHEPGRWFCEHLVQSRRRNKKRKEAWDQNLRESPLLSKSQFLSNLADAIYGQDS